MPFCYNIVSNTGDTKMCRNLEKIIRLAKIGAATGGFVKGFLASALLIGGLVYLSTGNLHETAAYTLPAALFTGSFKAGVDYYLTRLEYGSK